MISLKFNRFHFNIFEVLAFICQLLHSNVYRPYYSVRLCVRPNDYNIKSRNGELITALV